MKIERMKEEDFPHVLSVAVALPQWFTKGGIESIRKDIPFQSGLVAIDGGAIVGFLTFFVNQGAATIGWMGVLPYRQRDGIGTSLMNALKARLAEIGVKKIFVSTLGDSVDYEPYARTRSFYRKSGFVDFQKIEHPNNPEQEEELILCLDFDQEKFG